MLTHNQAMQLYHKTDAKQMRYKRRKDNVGFWNMMGVCLRILEYALNKSAA